jgi:LmbE family N-acetylglucosaminyl deacetylase
VTDRLEGIDTPLRLPGAGRTVLFVSPHADDAALFCGGTLRLMTRAGARVVLLRVTDDRYDSVGLDAATTLRRNADELVHAARHLGISEIVNLGWQTDQLGDASETALREQFIYHIRRVQPYAVFTFDPFGAYHEDNQDHLRIAAAVDESFWTAQFDKHHPEHLSAGLAPHGVYERWYFARRLTEVTTVVDISDTLDAKIDAALAHQTMMRHYVHQIGLQARTAGHHLPTVGAAIDGELRPFLAPLLRASARGAGAEWGLAAAETYRVVRFGGLERWFGLDHGIPHNAP